MISTLITYFEDKAIKLKDIAHTTSGRKAFFFADDYGDDKELLNSLRSAATGTVMILVNPSGRYGDVSQSDNYRHEAVAVLWILKKKQASGSASDVRSIFDSTLSTAVKLTNRIVKERREGSLFLPFALSQSTFEFQPVNNYGDGYCGYEIRIEYSMPFDFDVDNNDWTDLD